MNLYEASRIVLWGVDMGNKPTIGGYLKTKAVNRLRTAVGLKPQRGHTWEDLIEHVLQEAWQWVVSLFVPTPARPALPEDMPRALFIALDTVLRNRGGWVDRDLGPNYWLPVHGATSTPFFWSLQVDYAPTADPAKVTGFEMALEDAITRVGYDYNVRIQRRPLRIEVDKPKPPTVTLADLWPEVAEHEVNKRVAVVGLAYQNGLADSLFMTFEGEDFSAFIAASSGGGKTQLAMSILLSLAMTNSPESLAIVIVDPKSVDFRPFNALPHLALPVVNEPAKATEVVQWLCDEMGKRTAQAARGDNTFFKHSILLYIDELADLVMSLPDVQARAFTNNIQRLGQKGRGVGFVIIGATQRVYDIDASMHSKLNARFVGKMRTANDSVAASGIPGTTTNKLPGRGSFELYCSDQQGLRIQAPFVAASDKPGYEKSLASFFNDIRERWGNARPGWSVPGAPVPEPPAQNTPKQRSDSWEDELGMDTAEFLRQMSEQINDQPKVTSTAPDIDPALLAELSEEYKQDPKAFSIRTVRRIGAYLYHKEIRHKRAKAIFELFMKKHAADLLES